MEKMYAEKPGWLPTVFRELRELIMFNLSFNYLMSYPNCHNSSVLTQAGFCYLLNWCEHHDENTSEHSESEVYPFRFHRLQKEFECDGRYAPEGSRKGRQMRKPNTLRAESWFNSWLPLQF